MPCSLNILPWLNIKRKIVHHQYNYAKFMQFSLVMFSHGRILREHSMIFLYLSLQNYCEEQQKISACILLIIPKVMNCTSCWSEVSCSSFWSRCLDMMFMSVYTILHPVLGHYPCQSCTHHNSHPSAHKAPAS